MYLTVAGVSSNPCSEIYPGPEAFSEPESQSLRDFLDSISNLDVYLTFHSYGQYFLFPWGYGRVEAPNNDDLVCSWFLSLIHFPSSLNNIYVVLLWQQAAGDAAVRGLNGDKSWIVGNSAIALCKWSEYTCSSPVYTHTCITVIYNRHFPFLHSLVVMHFQIPQPVPLMTGHII